MWLCQVETIRQHCHHPVLQGLTRSRMGLTALCTPDRRNDYGYRRCVLGQAGLRCININLLISGRILMTSDSLTFPYIEQFKLATWAIYLWLAVMFCQDACLTAHQSVHFSVTQSCPTLRNPMTAAPQASPSISNLWSLLKLRSIESVMPSNHFVSVTSSPSAFNIRIRVLFPLSWLFGTVTEMELQHQLL